MVFNAFGEGFYVKGAELGFTNYFIGALWPFMMPLLFLISGIGSYYSLEKRSVKEYLAERVDRILIPLIFGVLLLAPFQTFFAERFHNNYKGNYLQQYLSFFTKPTDLSGYTGGFTPAHLWFLLYLFVISLVSLPLMNLIKKSSRRFNADRFSLPLLIALFILPAVAQVVVDIDGKSLGEYLVWFLLGYFIFSKDEVVEKLKKNAVALLILTIVLMVVYVTYGFTIEKHSVILYELLYGIYAHISILAILGMGSRYLEFTTSFTSFMLKSSFSVYLLHQQWIVLTAYFAVRYVGSISLQVIIILISSIMLTYSSYCIFRRVPIVRRIFGLY